MDKNKRSNWNDFKEILDQHHITRLYHFTDRDNLESIIKNGGLYSWPIATRRASRYPSRAGATPREASTVGTACSTCSI